MASLAGTVGPAVPFLNKVAQFLDIAKFVHSVLSAGLECENGIDAVIVFLGLTAILSLLRVEIVVALSNPLAGFFVGAVMDQAINALVGISGNCRA